MQVRIKILGLPLLTELMGKESALECCKESIKDLVETLIKCYGPAASHALLDSKGSLDRSIQVVINDEDYVNPKDFEKSLLKNGDGVTFVMLIAGG